MGVRVVLALSSAVSLAGCQAILGIDDTRVGGQDGATGDGGNGDGPGTPDGGPDAAPDFTFAILPANVAVPYNGTGRLDVQVTRIGGFDGEVTVDAPVPPNPSGLSAAAVAIPPGATRATLLVGASGGLSLGTSFTLSVRATSGTIERNDDVPAEVTGRPGSFDTTYGTGGIFQIN